MPLLTFDGSNGTQSLTASGELVSLRMEGFNAVILQVTDAGTGNTISFETSNDGETWVPCSGDPVDGGLISLTMVQITGMWKFPATGKFFRASVSAYASGTVTVYWYQRGT
jgi:hypothetical protein